MAVIIGLLVGCKPADDKPAGFFKTPFQDETRFLVETIVSDLATQMYFASHHQLPDPKHFSVRALEKPGSPFGAPVYDLTIALDPKRPKIKLQLNVNGPIWSPDVYDGVAAVLAKNVGLKEAKPADDPEDTELLAQLTDGTAGTIVREDKRLSEALEYNFSNPRLHQQAAVLLGAFALRDHAGFFHDTRLPLCQITAHLVLAQTLSGGEPAGINGQMAGVMLSTLMNNRATALDQLNQLKTTDAAISHWSRALRAQLTGDYRPLTNWAEAPLIERVARFQAYTKSANADQAWAEAANETGKAPDFCRIAEEERYSVGTAHGLMRLAMSLETKEISEVYELAQGQPLKKEAVVAALNQLSGHGFLVETGKTTHVQVIGWGQWAMFLQRHLCQSIVQNSAIYEHVWGLHAEARSFNDQVAPFFNDLRLYPFVRVMNCLTPDEYRQSLDAAAQLTQAEPQQVPGDCWNHLWFRVRFAEIYQPVPFERFSEWFNQGPPPGTAYDLRARLKQNGFVQRADAAQQLARLHELAPWDRVISDAIVKDIYHNQPTYAQMQGLLDPILKYDAYAMLTVARTVTNQPDIYMHWLTAAAELQPACYFTLGDYFFDRGQEDKAAGYYEQAQAQETDSLISARYASRRIKYYLKQGEQQKAAAVADAAGEVYSYQGLAAKAEFYELTGKHDDAFEWYAKIEERYNDAQPLRDFCLRYKTKTGDPRFETALRNRASKIFPQGSEPVSLADFHAAPGDGVLIQTEGELLRQAGLKAGDVIVALAGIRMHNSVQYNFQRDLSTDPEMILIVWQGDQYREIKASPPNHRFGVKIGNYKAK